MNTKWNYAYHVQRVHQAGGPEAFMKKIRQSSFDAGYLTGRSEGLQTGILCMVPFVAGCCYLAYEKWPIIWNKIRIKMYLATRKELTQKAERKNLGLELVCPNCGKKAYGIDEVIKQFGFDKTDDGDLVGREVCRECFDNINKEE